jgi:hypothetical protein
MSTWGLLDRPIESIAEDTLKLQEHAKALARFIGRCDTAMTIAIQGDWGSGKTSMMKMVMDALATGEDKAAIRQMAWVNTWELAQFGQAENLPVLLLSELARQLAGERKERHENLKKVLLQVGRASLFAAATAFGQGDAVKAGAEHLTGGETDLDMVALILRLKRELEALITDVTKGDPQGRVVVFIDDLDRLVPVRAVELLEVMKVFLDIPGCVFVLACDYQVVMKGLTAKFGVGEAQLSGKSFFDKIIQVPYSMPLHQYDVNTYMKGILSRICSATTDEDVSLYRKLTETSVGFNPRSLKRTMNALMLMKDVTASESEGLGDEREWVRILFAILCLQNAYPALFQFLCSAELSDKLLGDTQRQDFLAQSSELKRLLERDGAPPPDWQAMAEFAQVFYEALQLDSDQDRGKLSDQEIAVLKKLLDSSNLVAVQHSVSPRRMTSDELRGAFRDKCATREPEAAGFFDELFGYVDAHRDRIELKPGTQGFALWNRVSGKSALQFYPPSEKSRARIAFVTRDYPEDLRAVLKDRLRSPEAHDRLDKRATLSADLRDFRWENTGPILNLIFGVDAGE